MINAVPVPLERRYHKFRADMGLSLHNFVLLEEQELTIRMRRRFHIHACILSALGLLNYLATIGALSVILLSFFSPLLLLAMERIDEIGQF